MVYIIGKPLIETYAAYRRYGGQKKSHPGPEGRNNTAMCVCLSLSRVPSVSTAFRDHTAGFDFRGQDEAIVPVQSSQIYRSANEV